MLNRQDESILCLLLLNEYVYCNLIEIFLMALQVRNTFFPLSFLPQAKSHDIFSDKIFTHVKPKPKSMKKLLLMVVFLIIAYAGFSQTIFTENFQSAWTLPTTLSPAWSGTTTPANIESDDINAVGNDAAAYVLGFTATDIYPDAQVESSDINIVGNNAALYIYAHIPM